MGGEGREIEQRGGAEFKSRGSIGMDRSSPTNIFLSRRLSVCSHASKITRPNFTKLFMHVTCERVAQSYSDDNVRYVLPVLWMTSNVFT